jgi:hypothetical protein
MKYEFLQILESFGTLSLAAFAFVSMLNDGAREKKRNYPLVVFDFYDIGDHESLGPPGFRNIQYHPIHPSLQLSGMLRNISGVPVADCRISLCLYRGLGENASVQAGVSSESPRCRSCRGGNHSICDREQFTRLRGLWVRWGRAILSPWQRLLSIL